MRKIVVVGAAAILSLGAGGTALAASNGLDSSGLSVRPASTASPSHDAGDDHGGDRPAGVTDDGAGHDANDANDDHGGNSANDVSDDHGGDRARDTNAGPGSASSGHNDGAGHDAGDDHGGR